MGWQLVLLDSVQAAPWRNGGGTTRELLAWPDAAGWKLRISVADVTLAGPFSRFPGIERWFAVLEGEGVVLDVAGARRELGVASEPLRFDGAAAVDCALRAGPTRDLNLMTPPGRGRMHRIAGVRTFRGAPGAVVALYVHGVAAHLRTAGAVCEVPPRTLAWQCVQEAVEVVVESAAACWMEVLP